MSDTHTNHSLLDELDERQDELLNELDALDRKIEFVLAEWTVNRTGEGVAPEKAA